MTDSPDEYGEILRRALRAEADTVVPSPEGLEIIRARIEQRGPRGFFWWRAAGAAAGAVLVAATIVMVVPDLREQAIPPSQGITHAGQETDAPENASTSRPPASRPPQVSSTDAALPPPIVTHGPTVVRSPSHTAPATPAPDPTRECVTPKPKPTPSIKPKPCPSVTPTPTQNNTPTSTATAPTPTGTCGDDCSLEQAPTTDDEGTTTTFTAS
ncbi:MAG TPA: hypothetical protein VIR33_08495 [Thermopolyspora sp.]|jgi:Predicted solute binding protein